MIRLIAFDLDGTVLNEHKKMLPETKNILERAAGEGIEIVPATGRPFIGMIEEIHNLKGVRYILTSNGAGIYEKESGKCVYENCMPLGEFLPLLERLEKLEVMADTFVRGQGHMNENKKYLISNMAGPEEIKDYIRTSRLCVPSQSDYLRKKGFDVEKLTINFSLDGDGNRIDYDRAWDVVRDYPEFCAVSGGMHNIEITQKNVSKASGLRQLGKKLGIMMEEMLVFGDSGNDLAMIKEAGIGVAMSNGEKEVLEAADFITKSNDENGIVYAIQKYLPHLLDERDRI